MIEKGNNPDMLAQVVLPTKDLPLEIAFFTQLGFRLDHIFPADSPAVAMMSGFGLHIRIDKDAAGKAPVLHLLTDDPDALAKGKHEIMAPNGTMIHLLPRTFQLTTPRFSAHILLQRMGKVGL